MNFRIFRYVFSDHHDALITRDYQRNHDAKNKKQGKSKDIQNRTVHPEWPFSKPGIILHTWLMQGTQ